MNNNANAKSPERGPKRLRDRLVVEYMNNPTPKPKRDITQKPAVDKCYVLISDPSRKRKSVSATFYGITPEEMRDLIERAAKNMACNPRPAA